MNRMFISCVTCLTLTYFAAVNLTCHEFLAKKMLMITQKPKTVLKIDFAAFKPNKTAL